MQDMKLRELMPVGKIEPRKSLMETVHTTWGDGGIIVSIDNYDDVTLTPHGAGVKLADLGKVVDVLVQTRWFVELILKAAKRHVTRIKVTFSNDGISFR